ncbi:uncharacterized protein QC763_0075040 [Podospora pseudopauciseta]|uniref:Uncharacterized protein n=1 Tax=Podospora pseudopauciseta TaxID=2093780 RepID=A0ABR0HAE3_9PEZI|nr:hypothetical protein QC763_0075040 [Podospora pseudopauciseta]
MPKNANRHCWNPQGLVRRPAQQPEHHRTSTTHTLSTHIYKLLKTSFHPLVDNKFPAAVPPVTLPITLPTTNSDQTTSNEDPTPTTALLTDLYQHTCQIRSPPQVTMNRHPQQPAHPAQHQF